MSVTNATHTLASNNIPESCTTVTNSVDHSALIIVVAVETGKTENVDGPFFHSRVLQCLRIF